LFYVDGHGATVSPLFLDAESILKSYHHERNSVARKELGRQSGQLFGSGPREKFFVTVRFFGIFICAPALISVLSTSVGEQEISTDGMAGAQMEKPENSD
jgi:hypothetical protein